MIQIGGVYTTFCQEGGIFLQKYAIEMGGVSRYFSKVSGSGVDSTLLIEDKTVIHGLVLAQVLENSTKSLVSIRQRGRPPGERGKKPFPRPTSAFNITLFSMQRRCSHNACNGVAPICIRASLGHLLRNRTGASMFYNASWARHGEYLWSFDYLVRKNCGSCLF